MAVKLPDQSSTTVSSITSALRAEPALGTRAATTTAPTVDEASGVLRYSPLCATRSRRTSVNAGTITQITPATSATRRVRGLAG
jgi:hypothetical protein